MCVRARKPQNERSDGWRYTVKHGRGGRGALRVCAIEQPPVKRGSMLTRMVNNTAWGNSSFTPRLKPSSLFCLPSSVNISLSPETDSGVNRNQIMHANISVTQDFLCLPPPHSQTVLFCSFSFFLFLTTLDYSTGFLLAEELCARMLIVYVM